MAVDDGTRVLRERRMMTRFIPSDKDDVTASSIFLKFDFQSLILHFKFFFEYKLNIEPFK